MDQRELKIPVADLEVAGLLWLPEAASALLVLAHGAGAGMEHHGMESLATTLAEHGVASLRYQFPYRHAGRRRPDPPAKLVAAVRAAVDAARRLETGLPLFAGGRSMGGRMTSTAQAEAPLPEVDGLVFFAFPLHPAGRPGTGRADHLARVDLPMLFLQGTRDRLAESGLLVDVLEELPTAGLHWLQGADHSFAVLKRSGRTPEEVMVEIGATASAWIASQR